VSSVIIEIRRSLTIVEIDLLGGIAGAAKAGLQATERPAAPPLSRAGIDENDLLPSIHEEP
jgi:hypothetical protein